MRGDGPMSKEEYVGEIVYVGDVPVPSLDMNQRIVRCKDCKYAHMSTFGHCKYCDVFVLNNDGEYQPQVCLDANFFCGFGERRDE